MDQSKKDVLTPSTSKGSNKLNAAEIEKPLLRLLKHLVNFLDCEERTVLTNSQLMNILYKEFNINTAQSHTLEVDIYMNILKRFLKEWPRWGAVDSLVQSFKVDKSIKIESYLNEEYICLKKYLKEILDMSKESVEASVKKVSSAVAEGVLEVSCSRSQLNQLFYKSIHPEDKTIFHILDAQLSTPSKINVNTYTLSHILNWPFVNISIDTVFFEYTRKNVPTFKHTLINKNLGVNPPIPSPSPDVLCKSRVKSKKSEMIDKSFILEYVNFLLGSTPVQSDDNAVFYKYLLNLIKDDMRQAPDQVDKNMDYMYFLHKHPYVRYLNGPDIPSTLPEDKENPNLNLALQEYIMPSVVFNVGRILPYSYKHFNKKGSFNLDCLSSFLKEGNIRLECAMCEVKCLGICGFWEFTQHFMEAHKDEKDWQCPNCYKKFSMAEITVMKWTHTPCVKNIV